ncbi:MAG: transglycosylase SLT domain-containing protein [Burkholderiaceae bacterium]|nr:transglycosylase SLT domain-containing protein [Burkholderiaceae bacterium]
MDNFRISGQGLARILAGAGSAAAIALFAGCASVAPPEASSFPNPQTPLARRVLPVDSDNVVLAPPAVARAEALPARAGTSSAAPVVAPAGVATSSSPQASVDSSEASQAGAGAPGAAVDALAPLMPPADAREALPAAPRFDNLWDRIRAGFAMPALDTPLIAEKERFYLERPDYLQRMFARGGRYLHHIVEEIERRGLPTELALLPFVESAMNPVAVSSAKASGLWQFIPSTGKAYDLHQNWWVDNRRDVVKSTNAALDYLQKIYAMHGDDWFLALASYNWGEGAVGRAVKKNQARGKPADYLSLGMPNETRHYIPKLIALKNIVSRAAQLGVVLPDLPNRPYFVTIEKTRPIDLKLAAKFAGMSVEEFVALNPAHNRPVIAASRNNEIKLPADRVAGFTEAVEKHEDANKAFATWQPYTLKAGESLEAVALRTRVSAAELRTANGLRQRQRIVAGTRMLVPHAVVTDESSVEKFAGARVYEQVDRPALYHTVRARESLATIASKYGVSAATLAAWNGVKDGLKEGVKRGMRLLVRPAATQTLLTDEVGRQSVVSSSEQRGATKAGAKRSPSKPRAAAPNPIRKAGAKPAPAAPRLTRPSS